MTKFKSRFLPCLITAFWLGAVILFLPGQAAAISQPTIQTSEDELAYYSSLCLNGVSDDVDWGVNSKEEEVLQKFHEKFDGVSDGGLAKRNAKALGFFDWILDLFGWLDDAKEEIEDKIEQEQNEQDIPDDAYTSTKYGMNLHDVDTMSVDDLKRTLAYSGSWVRISISPDEVADENWSYRLDPFLTNLSEAADSLGIEEKLIITMTGYSTRTSGSDYLLESLSWDEKAARYGSLAYTLATHVHSMGYTDAIFESWNEPDNDEGGLGIGLSPDDPDFVDALVSLNNSFSAAVKLAHGYTAFSPFMTLNDTKIDLIEEVWLQNQAGFDYFSVHYYDDEPGVVKFYAEQAMDFIGDRPVLVTEHGYQQHQKDSSYYRRQAWALEQGFNYDGDSTLVAVLNYVYASTHDEWVIEDDEDFFWKVTHDSRPIY